MEVSRSAIPGVKRGQASIKDIAREAGVSHPTVSRALNDSPLVSPETKRRIRGIAREMGYMPNAVARSLLQNRTNTVGLIVTSISDPFLGEVAHGIEEVARPAGLSVFLSSSYNEPEEELRIVETFHRRRVDGIIVASSRFAGSYAHELARVDVPVVLVSSQVDEAHERLHGVTVDDHGGAASAVEHLLALGHRRIGYLGVANRPRSNSRRREGYLAALRTAPEAEGRDGALVATDEGNAETADVEVGRRLAGTLLDRNVTAFFCYNDMVALGALLALRERGVPVPGACSIVGFDDVELARYLAPPLTTVSQPKRELGRRSMELLLSLLDARPASDLVLPTRLVVRASSGPPPS